VSRPAPGPAIALVILAGLVAVGLFLWRSGAISEVNPGEEVVTQAWERVRREPRSTEAWSALGDAQARVDQIGAAEHSYRTALRLDEHGDGARARLGFLLYGAGRDQEALAQLQRARDDGARLPMLDWTIEQLEGGQRKPEPVAAASDGAPTRVPDASAHDREQADALLSDRASEADRAPPPVDPLELGTRAPAPELPCAVEIERSARLGTFRVPVRFDDEIYWMILDTGASITVVTRELVDAVGLEVDTEQPLQAITATGLARFDRTTIPRLTIAERAVEGVTAAVCDDCAGDDAVGLLGLDVQAALGLELRLSQQRAVFVDCEE